MCRIVACRRDGAGANGRRPAAARRRRPPKPSLRLATTTSTADTGLFKAILPAFETQCGCRVDVVAVGTGQALEIGRRGDADVLLVHAPEQEAAFMAEGHAVRRDDVMYNDFVIVGPAADPAGVAKASTAKDAFRRIHAAAAAFASRGDRSGTHTKELALWKAAGIDAGCGRAVVSLGWPGHGRDAGVRQRAPAPTS